MVKSGNMKQLIKQLVAGYSVLLLIVLLCSGNEASGGSGHVKQLIKQLLVGYGVMIFIVLLFSGSETPGGIRECEAADQTAACRLWSPATHSPTGCYRNNKL